MADDGEKTRPGSGRRKYGGLTRLSAFSAPLEDKALRRRGFTESRLVSDWPAIVGEQFAEVTAPERIAFPRGATGGGTLHLRVAGAAALEVQHQLPMLIERINMVFGYGAVARVSLKQGPLPPKPKSTRPRLRDLKPEEETRIAASVSGVERSDLRQALEDLGKAVTARVEARAKNRAKS